MIDKVYEINDFRKLIEKAKLHRDLNLLNNTHTAILEYLNVLQTQHQKNITRRNYRLQSEISQLENLNVIIFGVYAHLTKTHSNSNKTQKRM